MSNRGNFEGNNTLLQRRTPLVLQKSAASKEAVVSNQARIGRLSISKKPAYDSMLICMLVVCVTVSLVTHCRK